MKSRCFTFMIAILLALGACKSIPKSGPTPTPFTIITTEPTTTPVSIDDTINFNSSMCFAPGTSYFLVSTPEIPEIILQHGTTITVTTNSDAINGNVSSVAALMANPGTDGISLREAIEATNNDPGEYTITFSPQLDDTTIYTGEIDNADLPPLLGGSVIINGDIDGDLAPDITIANATTFQYPFGFIIQSSNITIHALKLEGYFQGVLIKPATPTTTNTTIRSITVSNMVMSNVFVGINLHAGQDDEGTRASNNRWEDILLINNDLDVKQNGIEFNLNHTIGDYLDKVIVANNRILVTQDVDSASFGIQFGAGYWVGSNSNEMRNITITKNTIQGNPDQAIALLSGAVGASRNVIDGVSILENEILISDANLDYEAGMFGINLLTGDGASDYEDPKYEPIVYPEENSIRNVDIVGNSVEGFIAGGMIVGGGCCGARHNSIEDVNIIGNQFNSLVPEVEFNFAGLIITSSDGRADHPTSENLISNIVVQNNTFSLGKQDSLTNTHFTSAVISVSGSGGAPGANRNQVRDIWISLNHIDSIIPGIHLIGALLDSSENVINSAHIYCNTIVSAPIYPVWDPPLRGIVLTGAIGDSTLNRVENINLYYNNVAGIWNDLTVMPNVESTATNNMVDYTIYP
jgi:hypothetical protein